MFQFIKDWKRESREAKLWADRLSKVNERIWRSNIFLPNEDTLISHLNDFGGIEGLESFLDTYESIRKRFEEASESTHEDGSRLYESYHRMQQQLVESLTGKPGYNFWTNARSNPDKQRLLGLFSKYLNNGHFGMNILIHGQKYDAFPELGKFPLETVVNAQRRLDSSMLVEEAYIHLQALRAAIPGSSAPIKRVFDLATARKGSIAILGDAPEIVATDGLPALERIMSLVEEKRLDYNPLSPAFKANASHIEERLNQIERIRKEVIDGIPMIFSNMGNSSYQLPQESLMRIKTDLNPLVYGSMGNIPELLKLFGDKLTYKTIAGALKIRLEKVIDPRMRDFEPLK